MSEITPLGLPLDCLAEYCELSEIHIHHIHEAYLQASKSKLRMVYW